MLIYLLAAITILLFFIWLNIKLLIKVTVDNRYAISEYIGEIVQDNRKHSEEHLAFMESIDSKLFDIEDHLKRVEHVAGVYYKYRLPDYFEQKKLDEMI